VYKPPLSGSSTPAFTISSGISKPLGVALDRTGTLYVANYNNNTIAVYKPPLSGSSIPAFTISSGISGPQGVTFLNP
jgi:DNA-binding beta-propeller fold protein YncE